MLIQQAYFVKQILSNWTKSQSQSIFWVIMSNNNISPSIASSITAIQKQQTFVILKPDAVLRGLSGAILTRFENRGLKIVALKMLRADKATLQKHYPVENLEWTKRLGSKGKLAFESVGLDISDLEPNFDEATMGQKVVNSLIEYMLSGPIICMVIEGIESVASVRQMVGATLPTMAQIGTIRGDYSVDFPVVGLAQGRALHNLIHASETPQEAQSEINLWFTKSEITDYQLGNEAVMYSRYY